MSDRETSTVCGQCFGAIAPEPAGGPREACPSCGSTTRQHRLQASATVTATATATLTAIPYPRGLISIARGLIDDGLFGIAVVVAHIACEVATERAMTAAFTRRKLSDLKDPVTDLLPSNNLGNERTRRLFTALTRNPVEQQPFWGAFKESATRRNRVIHNALQVTQQEAESSLSVTTALVTFLKQ